MFSHLLHVLVSGQFQLEAVLRLSLLFLVFFYPH